MITEANTEFLERDKFMTNLITGELELSTKSKSTAGVSPTQSPGSTSERKESSDSEAHHHYNSIMREADTVTVDTLELEEGRVNGSGEQESDHRESDSVPRTIHLPDLDPKFSSKLQASCYLGEMTINILKLLVCLKSVDPCADLYLEKVETSLKIALFLSIENMGDDNFRGTAIQIYGFDVHTIRQNKMIGDTDQTVSGRSDIASSFSLGLDSLIATQFPIVQLLHSVKQYAGRRQRFVWDFGKGLYSVYGGGGIKNDNLGVIQTGPG